MKNLIKTIQNTAFQNQLWKKGDKIVFGVSGGPDSVCLLDAMSKIAPKYDLKLLIAHVNYGLRGKESDKDEEFVRQLGEKYGLKIKVSKPKVEPSGSRRLNLRRIPSENILRNIRYDFFEKVRKENNFDSIAVAHNADDQVETFLMRVIRGAGLLGLSAMKYKSGRVIRPLLNVSRKEILEYLKTRRLNYRIDRTNKELIFFRNKVRNKLLPFLEKNFNPNIRKTILGATASIAEDYDFLESRARKSLPQKGELSAQKLLSLHPALQRRVLLKKIAALKKEPREIEAGHIEEILKIARSTKNKPQFVVFKGLKVTRKGDRIAILSLK